MRNRVNIKSDGINVYAELTVKADAAGKIIVTTLILTFMALVTIGLSTLKQEEIGSIIIPIALLLGLIIAFPVRFLIWNMFGKEYLVINTKTISYNYDYGLIRTNLKTIKFNRLGTDFEEGQSKNGMKQGYLVFYNYREEDNLPEIIHKTTILTDYDNIRKLDQEIHSIFESGFNTENRFIPYSAN